MELPKPGERPYRCYNPDCSEGAVPGHDFHSAEAKCPKCGVAQSDTKLGRVIVPLVSVHYDAPAAVRGTGLGTLACNPAKSILGYRATGEPTAVTCPHCRETDAWKNATKAAEFHPDHDVVFNVDTKAGTLKPCSC